MASLWVLKTVWVKNYKGQRPLEIATTLSKWLEKRFQIYIAAQQMLAHPLFWICLPNSMGSVVSTTGNLDFLIPKSLSFAKTGI